MISKIKGNALFLNKPNPGDFSTDDPDVQVSHQNMEQNRVHKHQILLFERTCSMNGTLNWFSKALGVEGKPDHLSITPGTTRSTSTQKGLPVRPSPTASVTSNDQSFNFVTCSYASAQDTS